VQRSPPGSLRHLVVGRARLRQRGLAVDGDEGVQGGIQRGNAIETIARDLDR
jgi:hypothetical protein